MWHPKKLIIENFRSFVYQEYDFKRGAFLVQGINNTDEGSKSNGSGKSSFKESICYCLGLPTVTDTITDLINKEANFCKVYHSFFNDITKEELEIIRSTPLKGSTTLEIILNGKNQKDKFATVRDGDRLIIDLIGISKEDLLNHYLISEERFTSFFSSSDTKVKELISRFSNFNKIDGVEDIVQADLNQLNEGLNSFIREKDKLEGKLELLNDDLLKEVQINPNEAKNKRINELKLEIDTNISKIDKIEISKAEASKIVFNLKGQKVVEETKLETLQKELESLGEINFDDEINKIKEEKNKTLLSSEGIESENSKIKESIKEFKNFKIEVETAIEGAIKCPKCLHEFIPNDEIDIEEAKNNLPIILEELKNLNGKVEENQSKLLEIEGILSKYNEKIKGYQVKIDEFNQHKSNLSNKIYNVERGIQRIENDILTQKQNIISYDKSIQITQFEIDGYREKIEEIKKKEVETREKEIKESIKIVESDIEKVDVAIQEQKDKIFDKEQWIFRFKKFRSSLANESLEIIQGYTNMYLKKMKTNLSIQLEGYKTKKDGSLSEKITPIILRDGIQEGTGNYKKFSGGERGRIDIAASILAVQSLINNSCPTGGLDYIFIDEVTDKIDSTGLENIVDSLALLNKFCFIVSQVTHEKTYENIITIEKNGGVSKIV